MKDTCWCSLPRNGTGQWPLFFINTGWPNRPLPPKPGGIQRNIAQDYFEQSTELFLRIFFSEKEAKLFICDPMPITPPSLATPGADVGQCSVAKFREMSGKPSLTEERLYIFQKFKTTSIHFARLILFVASSIIVLDTLITRNDFHPWFTCYFLFNCQHINFCCILYTSKT